MAQEFVIKSQAIEDKVNQLLPSQGGFGAGVDFSASTMVVPIVDLTETATGSSLRLDLQTAYDNATTETASVNNTVTAINTTGFYKVYVTYALKSGGQGTIDIFDGVSAKNIRKYFCYTSPERYGDDEFIVFLSAGLSMRLTSSAASNFLNTYTRQIADISGNLTNPVNF